MGFFGTKKVNVGDEDAAGQSSPAPVSSARASGKQGGAAQGRVGIDHAIMLMRSLPTEKNPELVIAVLKTTLESLNIHVADIVADAATRENELDARAAQLKIEIASLEEEITKRAEEIRRLDAARVETSQVREYLEADDFAVAEDHP